MGKGNRLRAKRTRHDIEQKRQKQRQNYWRRNLEALKAKVIEVKDAAKPAADERPCGGVGRCVTRNGTTASHPHVGCQK